MGGVAGKARRFGTIIVSEHAPIARLHPHLLRHRFSTHYPIAGGDVFHAAEHLR